MNSGRVLMANHHGDYVIKLTGDVRMTLCTTLDSCITDMIEDTAFKSVMVDLRDAEGVDSTTLGLLAKISRLSLPLMGKLPLLVSSHSDITRLVESMGFRDCVYRIVSEVELTQSHELREATATPLTQDRARAQVIEAHKILMSLNDANRQAFKELIECIEKPLH